MRLERMCWSVKFQIDRNKIIESVTVRPSADPSLANTHLVEPQPTAAVLPAAPSTHHIFSKCVNKLVKPSALSRSSGGMPEEPKVTAGQAGHQRFK